MTYIYGIKEPISNKVVYVGKTKEPEKRLMCHAHSKTNLSKWFRSIGLKPEMVLFERCRDSISTEREIFWISLFGVDNLFNKVLDTKENLNIRRMRQNA